MEQYRTIGELAQQAGVGVETIRYYERRGLLATPTRSPSGYRRFNDDALRRLRFIRRAKDLGFTLRQIRELLALRLEPGATCEQVKARAEAKLADIESKARTLQRMAGALRDLTRACEGRPDADADDCPILKTLEDDDVAD